VSLSVLIVDDSASFLDAARAFLQREGASVVGTASTVRDGVRQAHLLAPDVVLVDIVLDDESGFALARELAGSGARAASIVLTSTHAEEDFAELIAESPAIGFLPKQELSVQALGRILDGARAHPGT
jgi:DNA-binding NarL/FixJ family response regulator